MTTRRGSGAPLARGSAPGKIILLGEHAVVHGEPAIAAAIDRSVTVRIAPADDATRRLLGPSGEALTDPRLAEMMGIAAQAVGLAPEVGFVAEVSGDLPIGVGLGSSAALAVALCRALLAWTETRLSEQRLLGVIQRIETVFHGTPSGIDGTTCATGGVLWYRRGVIPQIRPLSLAAPLSVVVALSGEARTTARLVGELRTRAAARPSLFRPLFTAIGEIVRAAEPALRSGDRATLGEAFSIDHALLRACGVSTPGLDDLVARSLRAGALGAKLTGAGGGGAVIALPRDGEEGGLCAALALGSPCAFVVKLGVESRHAGAGTPSNGAGEGEA